MWAIKPHALFLECFPCSFRDRKSRINSVDLGRRLGASDWALRLQSPALLTSLPVFLLFLFFAESLGQVSRCRPAIQFGVRCGCLYGREKEISPPFPKCMSLSASPWHEKESRLPGNGCRVDFSEQNWQRRSHNTGLIASAILKIR